MQFIIRGSQTFILNVSASERIASLIQRIADVEKCQNFCVYVGGKPLDLDNPELTVASLPEGHTLDVSVPLKGGKVHGKLNLTGKVKGLTPYVERQAHKKLKTGRARQRQLYNKRFKANITDDDYNFTKKHKKRLRLLTEIKF